MCGEGGARGVTGVTGMVVVVFGVRGKGEGKERRWGRGASKVGCIGRVCSY
jgi:hypothetical protein